MAIKLFLAFFIIFVGLSFIVFASEQGSAKNDFSFTGLFSAVKNLFVKLFVYIVEFGEKAIVWLREHILKPLIEWAKSRGVAIKQGIGEEKEELEQGLFNYLRNFWEKVKKIFGFHIDDNYYCLSGRYFLK